MKEYLITAIIEGERTYFMGLMPNCDASWTTQRGMATQFRMLAAAHDTATALRIGEVVGATDGRTYKSPP